MSCEKEKNTIDGKEISEEDIMAGGFLGKNAGKEVARRDKLSKSKLLCFYDFEEASSKLSDYFDLDDYDIESTLTKFVMEIISDAIELKGKVLSDEELNLVATDPHLLRSIYINYINATGNLEERLTAAITNALPLM